VQFQTGMLCKEEVNPCILVNPLAEIFFQRDKKSWGRKGDRGNDANPSASAALGLKFVDEPKLWLPPFLSLFPLPYSNQEASAGYWLKGKYVKYTGL
jgi:hypothetical protein